jgi:hypothetical protein
MAQARAQDRLDARLGAGTVGIVVDVRPLGTSVRPHTRKSAPPSKRVGVQVSVSLRSR